MYSGNFKKIDFHTVDCIIVDGFHPDDAYKLGLEGPPFQKLKGKTPVIGVAKSNFLKNRHCSKEVYRGESSKPPYITSVGLELADATSQIKKTHSQYKMPLLFQQLDTKTKEP